MRTLSLITGFFITHFLFFNQTYAQEKDTLQLAGIPHPLRWENKPLSYKRVGKGITITAGEKTDMFRDPNVTYNTDNAPKLYFVTDVDFVFSASIEHSFANKWDGGALFVKQDSMNWVKFCFEKDYTGARRVVSVVTKNVSDDCNSIEIKTNKVFFKIAKAGYVITLYVSNEGQNWFLVRHLQFDFKAPLQVGFLSQSPTGKQCKANFQNIRYVAKTIKDPYVGD